MRSGELRKKVLIGAGVAAAFGLTLAAGGAQARYPYSAPVRTVEHSYTLGPAPFVKVDAVNGGIRVVGDGGGQVRLTASEHISAGSQGLLAQAEREVKLELNQTGDSLNAYVDGPFRCRHDCHWENPGYQVRFDFVLHVPAATRVELTTVNGDIDTAQVAGGFEAEDVNGSVEMQGLAGAGEARTVNGHIRAAFAANPRGDCTFRSLNGDINLFFQPGLNAVLRYKSFNGAVYSAFAVQPLPGVATASADRHGERVYRSNRFTRGQVGGGGPQITLDGFNGNIYIHRGQ